MKPFKFKQFTVHQDRCAMKVGTDGVLLGAWVSLEHRPQTILDVGSGTGLIALQLAQRSAAETIDAVELDADAYEQCVENFEASDWADRLFCYHASFDQFVQEIDVSYDLMISNPPFFIEDVDSGNKARNVSRQNHSLPFEFLVKGAVKLLAKEGQFALIAPFSKQEKIVALAEREGLFLHRLTKVRGHRNAKIKRILLQFGFTKDVPSVNELVIETSRHKYTADYRSLTQDFYLKM